MMGPQVMCKCARSARSDFRHDRRQWVSTSHRGRPWLKRVGAGAMGVVYAAYDRDLDRKRALKLLLPAQVGGVEDGPTASHAPH